MLTLNVPVGPENANREVKAAIEPIGAPSARPRLTQEEWQRFIDATAGSIADPTFQRHAQEDF
ncbi:MAG: hypothetical protein ACREJB_16425 [Planctomycetaceae bacterium]